MWSKRKSSHSQEFPKRIDLIRHFVQRVHDRRDYGSWAHLELVEEDGWFFNSLWGKGPWLEASFGENETLQLNFGFETKRIMGMPEIPRKWHQESRFLWAVPLADLPVMVDWIDECFSATCSGKPDRKLTGWTEGEALFNH